MVIALLAVTRTTAATGGTGLARSGAGPYSLRMLSTERPQAYCPAGVAARLVCAPRIHCALRRIGQSWSGVRRLSASHPTPRTGSSPG